MKSGINEKTTRKYLKVLRAFKLMCEDEHIKNAAAFAREHNVPTKVFSILKEKGVISKIDGSYAWTSIPPNIHMAREVQSQMYSYHKEKVKERSAKEVEPEKRSYKELRGKRVDLKFEIEKGEDIEPSNFELEAIERAHQENIRKLETRRVIDSLARNLLEPEVKREVTTESARTVLWGLFSSASIKTETEYK